MAAYTTITDAQVDPEAPITSELMSALRDNLIAVLEGDPSAPSILSNIANTTTGGGVGSYVFAVWLNAADGTLNIGDTVAGSQLRPAQVPYAASPGGTVSDFSATALSGTWRCMGFAQNDARANSSENIYARTVFLRIS